MIIYASSKIRGHIQSPVQSDSDSTVCTRAHAHMLNSFYIALCNDRQAVKSQTQALFSFKRLYTFMQSCHVLCVLHALHHFVTLLVCPGLDSHVMLHHYTCMHCSNWDSLIKQHPEYILIILIIGASVLRCWRMVVIL